MNINRAFARPTHETFKIKPIADLLARYVGDGKGWVDPYAGDSGWAEMTNDIDKTKPTQYHLDAVKFCKIVSVEIPGILIDPPYSYRQITEHYKDAGVKASYKDTSYNFYSRVYNILCPKVLPGGYAICCGWNSNGVGLVRGFEIVEILLVAHGLHHNDTIVTVERKINQG